MATKIPVFAGRKKIPLLLLFGFFPTEEACVALVWMEGTPDKKDTAVPSTNTASGHFINLCAVLEQFIQCSDLLGSVACFSLFLFFESFDQRISVFLRKNHRDMLLCARSFYQVHGGVYSF